MGGSGSRQFAAIKRWAVEVELCAFANTVLSYPSGFMLSIDGFRGSD